MPLDHFLEMDHFDLAARCFTAELERDALRDSPKDSPGDGETQPTPGASDAPGTSPLETALKIIATGSWNVGRAPSITVHEFARRALHNTHAAEEPS